MVHSAAVPVDGQEKWQFQTNKMKKKKEKERKKEKKEKKKKKKGESIGHVATRFSSGYTSGARINSSGSLAESD